MSPLFVPGILLQHEQLRLSKIHPLRKGKQSRAGAGDLARAAEHSMAIPRLLPSAPASTKFPARSQDSLGSPAPPHQDKTKLKDRELLSWG